VSTFNCELALKSGEELILCFLSLFSSVVAADTGGGALDFADS